MPKPATNSGVATLKNYIYVAGGFDDSNFNTADVCRYCVGSNQLQTMRAMNTKRWSNQLVELGGHLYAIGGEMLKSVERYHPRTDRWTEMASTHHMHYYSGATSHNGKIYVHSGNGFEVYSPESNTWRILTAAHQSRGSCLLSVNGKLWLLGGEKNGKSLYEFDTDTEQWTQLSDMDQQRAFFVAFEVSC